MNLLAVKFAGVPAAAESLHQINRTYHLLAKQLRFKTLAGEKSRLRSDHVKVTSGSADVPVVGDGKLAPRIFHGRALRLEGLRKCAQIADAVFHLLKRRENRLAIGRDRLIVRGTGGSQISPVPAAFEDWLQSVRAQRPEKAGRVEQRRNLRTLPTSRAAQRDLGIESRTRDADLRILVRHLPLGRGDVRTALQNI